VACYEAYGTSYGTNIKDELPWRGHGPWAAAVEQPQQFFVGPNFNPEKIFALSRYVCMIDLANIYEGWEIWLDNFDMGRKSGVGRWHETKVGDPWFNANALFADAHVSLGKYSIPESGSVTITCINCYVKADWSLYPLKYQPMKHCANKSCDPNK
jgi:prepilin-type processing-associated H-X9-DG protein